MTMPHVGFTGAARVGKDTAAHQLTQRGWQRVAFADPIRNMALAADPYVQITNDQGVSFLRLTHVVQVLGWDHAKSYPDVRRFLQRLGTDAVRDHLGRDVWVQAAMRQADRPTVFTDVRFPNEAAAIRAAGGVVIRLHRPDTPNIAAHISETAMAAWPVDADILNDGTPAELAARVNDVLAVHTLEPGARS